MKFLRNNLKVIIAFILGLILAGGIVYAATSAREVIYTTSKNTEIKNVEQALNDLYKKYNEEVVYPYIWGSGNTCNAYFDFSAIRNKKIYINCLETNNLNNTSTANMLKGTNYGNGNTWGYLRNVTGNTEIDVEDLISTYSINTTTYPYLIFNNGNYNGYKIIYAK